MILYHAVSSYQLLEMALYKTHFKNDCSSILFISQDVVRRLPAYGEFKAFFDDIWVYDNGIGNYTLLKGGCVTPYFDGIFHSHGMELSDFEELYISCVHHSFGIYLAEKNLPFNYMEDGAGALSRPEVLRFVEGKFENKDALAQKYGLYDASNPNIKKCIYNPKFQKEGFEYSGLSEYFDLAQELEQMPDKTRDKLIKIFVDSGRIPSDRNAALILTEHFANLRILSWDQQKQLYELLIDYFLPDRALIFKPHPDDLMPYKDMFPESHVIRERFPAELLPFLFETRPELVVTVSSTSIYGIQQCFSDHLVFNYDFSHFKKQFRWLHRYYVALSVLIKDGDTPLYTYGVNSVIPNNMTKRTIRCAAELRAASSIEELSGHGNGAVILIDEVCGEMETDADTGIHTISEKICCFLDGLDEDTEVIFINSSKDYCFYHPRYKHLWEHIVPVRIVKHEISQRDVGISDFGKYEDEYIFYFCKGGNRMGPVETRELGHSNTVIEADTSDQDLQMRALKGILAATEKRLLYYIKQTDILRKKLEGHE